MKKLISIIIALVMTLSISSIAFAEETTPGNTDTKVTVPQEIKDKKAQLKALFEEAKAIGSQLEATRGQVRSRLAEMKDKLKSMTKEVKAAAKEEFLALKEIIKADRAEIEALRAKLRLKTEAMQANRTQLREAMKADNYDTAEFILDDMLQIKADKNTDLENILELRLKMLDAVN
jgi:peptidoglycan hydrolase CwlO-like protein